MLFGPDNFLHHVKTIVTGGGRDSSGNPEIGCGFAKRAESLDLRSLMPGVTDSGGGTAGGTVAAGVGVQQISFDLDLSAGPMAATSLADVVTSFVPGYKFKLLALDFVTTVAGTGAGADQDLNLEIGSTDVTGGVCNITLSSTDTVGKLTAGAAISGNNTGTATDAVSIEVAGSGTAFTGGRGTLVVTIQNMDVADAFSTLAESALTTDETNARVLKIEETQDTVGTFNWVVPRDYDEATDILRVRVLASQLTLSTDNDVELDMEAYVKTAGSALGSDLNPTAPGTVLSTTEQWIEFDLAGNDLTRDDVLTIKLITNGANDTDGEEVLIHGIETYYRSTLVSYDDENDAESQPLR